MFTQTRFPIIAILAFALLASTGAAGEAEAPSLVGKTAPDFTLETPEGKSLTLSKVVGKRGVVLVFFATWCPACMTEVPEIKEFVKEHGDDGVVVFGINVRQSADAVKGFMEDKDVNYNILLDTDAEATKAYLVRGIPTVVGIDGAGTVRYYGHGVPKDTAGFVEMLTEHLPAGSDAK